MPPSTLPTTPLPPEQPQGLNKRMMVVALACGVLLILIIVGLSVWLEGSKNAATETPTPSAQSSSTPSPSPTPSPSDAAKAPAQAPTYDNFDNLTAQGFTDNQLEDLEYSLSKYATAIGQPGADISLNVDTINVAAPNPNSPTATVGLTYTFQLSIGSTSYHVTVNTPSDTAALTTIANASGAQVYSSGTVDLFNGIGDN